MNQIAPKSINFSELVKSSNTTLSLNVQNQLVERLNTNFTEDEQRWYVANLYMYMNYHPTNDYPINLENIFKMIGFANKGNAMKTIKSNFTLDEDYKVALFHSEKRKNEGGFNKEDVMLNVDTFKNLCMLAKTEKGKQIRKYYVKLENVYNELVKQEIDQKQIEIQQQKELLEKEKEQVKIIMNSKYNIDLTCNTKKNKWYLVFDKKTLSDNTQIFYIKDEALEYVNANYKLNY